MKRVQKENAPALICILRNTDASIYTQGLLVSILPCESAFMQVLFLPPYDLRVVSISKFQMVTHCTSHQLQFSEGL